MIFGYSEQLFQSSSKIKLWVQNWVSTHTKKPSISLFSQQSSGSVLELFFLSLVFAPWIWGFKGVDVAFLYIYTHLFYCFILL